MTWMTEEIIFLCRRKRVGGAGRFWLPSSELGAGHTKKRKTLSPGAIHPVHQHQHTLAPGHPLSGQHLAEPLPKKDLFRQVHPIRGWVRSRYHFKDGGCEPSVMPEVADHRLVLSRLLSLTGHYMVVREGLTNPWIPDNWSWGGVASDHCPVVAEFYPEVSSKELTRPGVAVVDRGDIMPKHERWQHPSENGWPLTLSSLDPAFFFWGGGVSWRIWQREHCLSCFRLSTWY